jgi:hypothetical protein
MELSNNIHLQNRFVRSTLRVTVKFLGMVEMKANGKVSERCSLQKISSRKVSE